MLRNALTLTALAFLTSGCKMAGTSGIWMFFVAPFPDDACEQTVTHNFSGATEPTETVDEEWTEEETFEGSPGVFFAQIFDAAGEDQKIMVVNDRTYLGNKEGGVWTFYWEGFETSTETEDHETGYHYGVTQSATGQEEFVLDISGNTITGDWNFAMNGTETHEESDIWDDAEVGRWIGETPSGQYLIDSQDASVWNSAQEAECTGNPCSLTVAQDCSGGTTLEGRQTTYDDDAFYGVEDAGQPFGLDL